MNLNDLIDDLGRMPGPDRKADRTIAFAIGMKDQSRDGEESWVIGNTAFRRVPAFTFSVDAALMIPQITGLSSCGACTFGGSTATAVLDDGERCEASTPAIATCMGDCRIFCA